MHRRWLSPLVLLLLLVTAASAFAQVDKASIEAVALDQTRAALPGVTVTVTRPETGFTTTNVTDTAGVARFNALAPGSYEVTFELEGFAAIRQQKVVLLVGQTAKMNGVMQQAASETITVSAAVPVVDVHKTDSSTNIVPEQIEDLPVPDREFEKLAFIAPGVQRERGGYRFIGGGPVIGAGGNASQSTILVNGVDLTDPALGLSRVRFSQDAIREFRVVANRFDTEVGGSAGGGLSIVTKSGTNELHGSVFGFFRDNALRAKKVEEKEKFDYGRRQVGLTIGGPVVQDRVFYFGSLEMINEDSFVSFQPGGKFASQAATVEHPFDRTLIFGALDFQISENKAAGVRAAWENYDEENFRVGLVTDVSAGQKFERENWNVTGEHNWSISSNRSNELRAQFGHRYYFEPTNSDAMAEYFTLGTTLQTGANILGDLLGEGDTWELRDTFRQHFVTGGTSHELKFGGSIQRVEDRSRIETFENGLMVWLTDERTLPYYYAYGVGSSDVTKDTTLYGAFVEDSMAIGAKTVVKLGLRYDLDTDGNNPDFVHPLVPNGRDRDSNNFQPRASFTYDLAGNGRNVVRGGAGRFTGRNLLIPAFNELQQNGVNGGRTLYIRLNGALFGLPTFALDPSRPTTTGLPTMPSIALMSPDIVSPESDQASLGWTTRLGSRLFLDTEAIYVKGRNEIVNRDVNFGGNSNPVRPNKAYQQINMFTNDGRSKYQALVVSLNGTVRRNDLITASFTLADKKNISDDFSPAANAYPSDPANIDAEYGRARGTERYRIVLSGVFHAPWDFTIAPIYEYGAGQPWTQLLGVDYNGDSRISDRPAGVGRNTMDGPPFRQLSLRVTKGFNIGMGQLEAVAEAFNVTNVKNYAVDSISNALYLSHPTIGNPNAAKVANPKYGIPAATFAGREIQLGLRWVY